MGDGTYRSTWIEKVFHADGVSAEVKVFMLFLAFYYMGPDGRVREPRDDLAKSLGCHPRKITAKFKAAIDSGLMVQTIRGGRGRTAEYQAVGPDVQGADTRHPMEVIGCPQPATYAHAKGAGFYPPNSTPQGADTRHPMGSQGADTRPPNDADIYKEPRTRAHSKTAGVSSTTKAADSRLDDNVVPLFDEELPPSAGAAAPPRGPEITAQTVVAAYVEGVRIATGGEDPDRQAKGKIAKRAKALLNEGKDPARLVEAARALGQKIDLGYDDLGKEYLMTVAAQAKAAGAEPSGAWWDN